MTRFINILLIVTITMLTMQLFFAPKSGPVVGSGGLLIVSEQGEYSVPNMPIIRLYGEGPIDVCWDLSIARNGAVMTGLPEAFCSQKLVLSTSGTLINMTPLAALFREEASYSIASKRAGTQASEEFSISGKGFFNAFFSALAYAPVYNLFGLVAHHLTGESFFWAIIVVTIIIRLLLLYPQHKVLVNSRRLQAIQPQMQELQAKHKGDQVALGQAVLELYKTEKVNPLSSITPLLLQMPILIVLYWIILDVKNPVNEYYLYPFLTDFDPTLLNTSAFGISLDETGGLHALALCIAIGLAQLVQVKLSYRGIEMKKKTDTEKKDPSEMPTIDPEFMRIMMMYGMPLIMAITTYFFPLGVGIYWFIGTLFMLVQQLVVNAYTRISTPKASKAVIDVQ